MIRYALAWRKKATSSRVGSAPPPTSTISPLAGELTCPVCDSREVRKQIMAPALAGTTKREPAESPAVRRAMMMEAMNRVRNHVKDNFDYVGDRFAAEARAIHEGQSEERGIYGEATPTEVKALVADGVPVAPLPPEPPKKTEVN